MNYIMDIDARPNQGLWNGKIALVGDNISSQQKIRDVIEGIGGNTSAPMNIHHERVDLEAHVGAVAFVLQISRWDDDLQAVVESIDKFCDRKTIPLLVLLPMDLVDDLTGILHNQNTEYLITDDSSNHMTELILTLNCQIEAKFSGVLSGGNDLDLVDLKKISADVDRIARVLSQLSGSQSGALDRRPARSPIIEPVTDSTVADNQFQFSDQSLEELVPFGSSIAAETESPISATSIRNLIKARRLRDQYFDPELFSDPAWDMLLDLMAAKLDGTRVSVSSLCIAAAVPPTTALRWIKTMTEGKVFVRRADENDGRRVFIELSDEAAAGMVGYLSLIHRSGLAII